MTPECIFCRIRDGNIPTRILIQDDVAFAISDINPAAPVHLLVIPRAHIEALHELTRDTSIIGHLMQMANSAAKQEGVDESGYRLVLNSGPDSGMEISHVHLHLLGGRRLGGLG